MKEKKKIVLRIIGILVVVTIIVGASYALWNLIKTQEAINILTTNCLKLEFRDQNAINLEKTYPITDEESKELTPYSFTISNMCDTEIFYNVNLEMMEVNERLATQYVAISFDENEKEILGNLTETEVTYHKGDYTPVEGRILASRALKGKTSITHSLRIWLDESVTLNDDAMDKKFLGKVVINATVKENGNKIAILDYINSIAETSEELAYDGTADNNVRYIGANPNNYASFGDTYQTDIYDLYYRNSYYGLNLSSLEECNAFKTANGIVSAATCQQIHSKGDNILWRIIGAMNNIDDGSGKKETRIKLIREESIGAWSWDSSNASINSGHGINEWSVSDIKSVLNDYYYNGLSNQTCYIYRNNTSVSCDFTNIAFPDNAKNLISNVIWNTGSNGNTAYNGAINTTNFYKLERSNFTGKMCSSGTHCNDTIDRTTSWTGKIGLIYPSDYGYATSGSTTVSRNTCLNASLHGWNNECNVNNWLYANGNPQWSIMPLTSHTAISLFDVNGSCVNDGSGGAADGLNSTYGVWTRPAVYLNTDVKIKKGIGTKEEPFIFI